MTQKRIEKQYDWLVQLNDRLISMNEELIDQRGKDQQERSILLGLIQDLEQKLEYRRMMQENEYRDRFPFMDQELDFTIPARFTAPEAVVEKPIFQTKLVSDPSRFRTSKKVLNFEERPAVGRKNVCSESEEKREFSGMLSGDDFQQSGSKPSLSRLFWKAGSHPTPPTCVRSISLRSRELTSELSNELSTRVLSSAFA
jgi:hypothetical protein